MSTPTQTLRRHGSVGSGQRGAASLAVVALLSLALLIAVGQAARHLAVEQRASAGQLRSTQAFEAAEAGAAWGLAMLSRGEHIDSVCAATVDPTRPTFRDARLAFDPVLGALVPRTWNDGGTPRPVRAACAWRHGAWSCSCPVDGAPWVPAGAGPAFVVEIVTGPSPGLHALVSSGCTRADGDCTRDLDGAHDAAARVESVLGLVPALRAAPLAALTVQGDVGADVGWIARRDDAAPGGLALQVGGSAAGAPRLGVEGPAGSPRASLLVESDTALATLGADRLFSRHAGVLPAAWRDRPGVARIRCSTACDAAVAAAAAGGSAMLHVTSDTVPASPVVMRGPLAVGTVDRPVALAVAGELRLEGAVAVTGFLHADSLAWTGHGGRVTGAVAVAGSIAGNGAPAISHDRAVLDRLRVATGTLAPLAGSWKDFR